MVDFQNDFENLWLQLQRDINIGDKIMNWTQHSGYLGDEFTICAVQPSHIEVDTPQALNIQHIPKEHFLAVYEVWTAYSEGSLSRHKLRDNTRFSKYIVSILHHLLVNN